jgi:hypothetical protein
MTRLASSCVRLGAFALVLMAGPGRAGAQGQGFPPAGAEDGRYTFHRIGDGFVRLNTRTGQLAQCGWAASTWSCKPVPEERAALDNEIGRLQRENADLKESLLSKGLPLPNGVVASAPVPPPAPPVAVPVPPATVPEPPAKAETPAKPDPSAKAETPAKPDPSAKAETPAKPDISTKEPRLPSDAEVDRAIAFVKNVWRKLVDMMVDLQRDVQKKS